MNSVYESSNATVTPQPPVLTPDDDGPTRAWSRGVGAAPREVLLNSVRRKITRLLVMPFGWDGFRATSISPIAGMVANGVLDLLVSDGAPTPQIAPLADGGLEIEWLVDGTAVQVQVSADGEVLVLVEAPNGRELLDGSFRYWNTDYMLIGQAKAYLDKMGHEVEFRVTAS